MAKKKASKSRGTGRITDSEGSFSMGGYINLVKENLRDIIAKLDPDKFYMSHKSCIINLDAVCKLENRYDIIMKDGSFMPLAQSKRMEFLNKLADNYITIIKGI